ncbi:hypothetical protein OESDEN_07326, partial [Oesophagostomum dentatum]
GTHTADYCVQLSVALGLDHRSEQTQMLTVEKASEVVGKGGGRIIVNGERFTSFAHRLEPHELNGLQIGGDVEITGIQMH